MSSGEEEAVVERFQPTNGRLSGVAGLVVVGVVLALGIHGLTKHEYVTPVLVVLASVLGLLLVWAVLLRPALWATDRDLVLRGIFHTDRVPLAAIDKVVVTQVLAVTVGKRRLVSPVVGYSARQNVRERRRPAAAPAHGVPGHQELVRARIEQLAQEARDRHAPTGDVRREWAWPLIAACVVLALAIVVWLLVR